MPLACDLLLFLCWSFLKNYVNRNWTEKNYGHKGTPWPCPLLDVLFFFVSAGTFFGVSEAGERLIVEFNSQVNPESYFLERQQRWQTLRTMPLRVIQQKKQVNNVLYASHIFPQHILLSDTLQLPFELPLHFPTTSNRLPELSLQDQSFETLSFFKSIPEAFIAWGSQLVLMHHVVNLHTIT